MKGLAPTKRRILNAAQRRVRQQGAEGLSMRRVAEDVGVSATALYRHYANRDDILGAIADAGFEGLAERMRSALPQGLPRERLLAVLDRYVEFALDEPELFDLMFSRPRVGARVFPDDFVAGASPTGNVVVELVSECMDQGEWRQADVWAVALALGAQAQGLIALYRGKRIAGDAAEFRRLCRSSLELLIRGLEA
jgi:AcrR family transcriptional regulator